MATDMNEKDGIEKENIVPAAVVAEDKVAADEPVAAKAEPSRGALGDAPFGEEVDEVEAERSFRRSGGGSGGGGGDKKKFFYTKKVCKFCTKQIDEKNINYKNIELMRKFVMPSGKIVPRRINGNCARHQRRVSEEIKKSRIIALLPFLDR